MSEIIEPRVLKGFRDILPDQQHERQRVVHILEDTVESYGFVPIDTPILEYADVLLGKGGDSITYVLIRAGLLEGLSMFRLFIGLIAVMCLFVPVWGCGGGDSGESESAATTHSHETSQQTTQAPRSAIPMRSYRATASA